MSKVKTRGTIRLDVDACKGCELCIPACPPGVLEMSTARNELGVHYPELSPGCTGCGACLLVCPDFCIAIYRYETPIEHEATA
jgi:2-oxoglutarate ferredoxin oxidoreductase subunit delta